MTLPRINSDKKARLFNRANEYRLNNESDKVYVGANVSIVAENNWYW